MIDFKPRNILWLTALGFMIMTALLALGVSQGVQLLLLGIFGAALAFNMLRIQSPPNPLRTIQEAPIRRKITDEGHEAAARAQAGRGYALPGVTLLDVGVISLQTGQDGLLMRRTRSISRDDDGVRPFVTLHVEPSMAQQWAMVRFEIHDQQGKQVYVHEARTYLRDGETNVIADHHLPLAANESIQGTGDWDLHVYIDDRLQAMHHFALTASLKERQARLSGRQASAPEAAPSLGDLLDASRKGQR
jgi:hypothetical protein